MSALSRVVRSGVERRRVQTFVIGLTAMVAVAASVLGGSLLVVSGAPFDDAFARQHGAHLSVEFDAARTDAGRVKETGRADGVAAVAGPFRTVSASPRIRGGRAVWPMTVVGRGDPDGPVDDLTLSAGRWAVRPGEIVLNADASLFPDLGLELAFPGLPGDPVLTVVGAARSVTGSADAWVTPAQAAALTTPGRPGGHQMLYRFTAADTAAQVAAGRVAVTAGGRAVTATRSWLSVRASAERDTALYVPFLLAFGVLGLVMSVLIVGNVVAGAVGAGLPRIGVLKAVGFTPAQVVRAYVGQALVTAAAGTVLGLLAAHLLAVPVMSETEDVYGTTSLAVAPWVDASVVAGVLGLIAVTAWASAWRAGRLRTADAIALGHGARTDRGRWAARLAGRLPLSRPLALGLTRPFARPARALATGTAILFGATAVTFTVGMGASLGEVMKARAHEAADVTVAAPLPEPGPDGPVPGTRPEPDAAAVAAAIEAQPGTRAYYTTATARATVSGAAGTTTVVAFTGDASWGGYAMVSGRWIAEPGEAAVPTPFLTATGTHLGDSVALGGLGGTGEAVTVRIVGEVLDPRNDGMQVFTDAATLAPAHPDLTDTTQHIAVTSGTPAAGYADALNTSLAPLGVTARAGGTEGGSDVVATLNALSALLTLMLVAVAALGVLNAVVLDTRERVRELGVHKALGMTPRQMIAMVVTSVVLTGLAGGVLGVLLGVALHGRVVPAMGRGAGLELPDSVLAVYPADRLSLLALGGLLIAVLGALLPAGRAAAARTATALRTE
ncbi:putative ABC transport system permease protein [Streptomyces achromogenes]|uniref:ABC transporter permease n=1 Tax=Streptomyces achromogenes TaxID=67255 RepID=UPI0027800A9B|nr:ABC transporter permease [Streptomyces achromogenes]MDQ0835024.1 putative ABC transport system permease protein [Streptomyces achromogenes]